MVGDQKGPIVLRISILGSNPMQIPQTNPMLSLLPSSAHRSGQYRLMTAAKVAKMLL